MKSARSKLLVWASAILSVEGGQSLWKAQRLLDEEHHHEAPPCQCQFDTDPRDEGLCATYAAVPGELIGREHVVEAEFSESEVSETSKESSSPSFFIPFHRIGDECLQSLNVTTERAFPISDWFEICNFENGTTADKILTNPPAFVTYLQNGLDNDTTVQSIRLEYAPEFFSPVMDATNETVLGAKLVDIIYYEGGQIDCVYTETLCWSRIEVWFTERFAKVAEICERYYPRQISAFREEQIAGRKVMCTQYAPLEDGDDLLPDACDGSYTYIQLHELLEGLPANSSGVCEALTTPYNSDSSPLCGANATVMENETSAGPSRHFFKAIVGFSLAAAFVILSG
jgi:hypothetical protein